MPEDTALERAWPFLKLENFWPKIRRGKVDECWAWTGAKFPKGHGAFGAYDPVTGRRYMVRAHRLVHFLHTGEQPEAVMHRCDNPACCNPGHLESGTVLLNNVDRDKKNRVRHGERHADAKLTNAEVAEIRSMSGANQREIGEIYGVSASLVSMILSGKRRKRA